MGKPNDCWKFEAEGGRKSLRNSQVGKNRLSLYFTSEFPFLTVHPALALNPPITVGYIQDSLIQ